MVPGAESAKVGCLRAAAGAAQKRHLGVVLGDSAGVFFHAIDLTHDQLHALLGVLADHAGVVGVGHRFREFVFNDAFGVGRLAGLMDARVPGVFHGVAVQAGDFDARARCQRCAAQPGEGCAGGQAAQNSAPHIVSISRHGYSNQGWSAAGKPKRGTSKKIQVPARSSMACSSTLHPAVMCSGLASSISLWLMPSLQGMKIMPLEASLAI